MNKKLIVVACIFVLLLYATTTFVPQGYISLSSDGKEILTEGDHLFSTHPFEYKKLFARYGNETGHFNVYAEDTTRIGLETNMDWILFNADADKIKYLSANYDGDGSANPIQGAIKAFYERINSERAKRIYGISYHKIIVIHAMQNTKIEFSKWNNAMDIFIAKNFTAPEERIVSGANQFLDPLGIEIISLSVSINDPMYDEAVRKKKEIEDNLEKMKNDAEKEAANKKAELERMIKEAELKNASITLPCFDWMDVTMNESLTSKKVCGYNLEIKAAKTIGNETPFKLGIISPGFENVRLTWVKVDGSRNFEEGSPAVVNKNFSLEIMEKDLIIKVQKREEDVATLQIERYGIGY